MFSSPKEKKNKPYLVVFFISFHLLFTTICPAAIPPRDMSGSYPIVIKSQSFQPGTYTPKFIHQTDSVIIPLKRAGRLFLIETKVGDQTGNLVLDTGANGLVLNSTYFREYLKSGGTISHGINGAVGITEQIKIKNLSFEGLLYENITADVTTLAHIENRKGVKILGLIGFSMLRKMEIVIDIRNNQLKLYKIDNKGKRASTNSRNFIADHMQKIEGNGNILFLYGKIGGKNLKFCFDTACETNAICSDCNRSIMNTLTITRRSSVVGAGKNKAEVLFGRMNDFTIGNKNIRDMETIVTNLAALNEAYGTTIDGMLGYNFMEQGVICINFATQNIGIKFYKAELK